MTETTKNFGAIITALDKAAKVMGGRVFSTESSTREQFSIRLREAMEIIRKVERDTISGNIVICLDQEESAFLAQSIVGTLSINPKHITEITLLIGKGHSGYGLYQCETEYPEEGSNLITNLYPAELED